MHYAEGLLEWWCPIDAPGDLLWFEGSGMPADTMCCHSEGWCFPATPTTTHAHAWPLTTLLYLFNTLNVKLTVMPLLAHVLPCMEVLYMHGLQVHMHTGLVGHAHHVGVLAQCFVIMGLWGMQQGAWCGVWDIDFVCVVWWAVGGRWWGIAG